MADPKPNERLILAVARELAKGTPPSEIKARLGAKYGAAPRTVADYIAAAEEQHRIVIGNADQGAQIGLGLRCHRHEVGAAVADFDDGRAHAIPFQHLFLRLAQNRFRQRRGAGTEIECARHVTPVGMKP